MNLFIKCGLFLLLTLVSMSSSADMLEAQTLGFSTVYSGETNATAKSILISVISSSGVKITGLRKPNFKLVGVQEAGGKVRQWNVGVVEKGNGVYSVSVNPTTEAWIPDVSLNFSSHTINFMFLIIKDATSNGALSTALLAVKGPRIF